MSADLSPTHDDVLALLRGMLRVAVVVMADGLRQSMNSEADADGVSIAFAALADAYRALFDDVRPATLSEIVALVARFVRPDDIFARALKAGAVPLNASMSDASEAALWRALKDATSRYLFGAWRLLSQARSDDERSALRRMSEGLLQAYAFCLQGEAGRVHPKQIGDALDLAWGSLHAAGLSLTEFRAACGLFAPRDDWAEPRGADDPEDSER